MKRLLFFFAVLVAPCFLIAQKADSAEHHFATDSLLQEVTVTAFHSRMQWKSVPAAVAILGSKEMDRYTNTSFVPLFNTVPGVRIEERSPASYRLSIRGSLLRSPFGVRNVKIYWDDIPLTDAGGNTYLNLVDMNTLTSAEIIKGPAASVYGANTGGAVLLRSDISFSDSVKSHFTAGISAGAYGLFQEQLGWQHTTKKFISSNRCINNQMGIVNNLLLGKMY